MKKRILSLTLSLLFALSLLPVTAWAVEDSAYSRLEVEWEDLTYNAIDDTYVITMVLYDSKTGDILEEKIFKRYEPSLAILSLRYLEEDHPDATEGAGWYPDALMQELPFAGVGMQLTARRGSFALAVVDKDGKIAYDWDGNANLMFLEEDWGTYVTDSDIKPVADLFTDVAEDAWYAEYVFVTANMGLFNGKAEGIFAPDDQITVAEALTLAARLDGGEEMPEAEAGAPWYQSYVDYAKENGLPWEYADYNKAITRAEFAHIFAAIYRKNEEVMQENDIVEINEVRDGAIPDVPADHAYAEDIYLLYRLGVVGGSDEARSFLPDTNIRRSEVAAILCRILDVDRQEFTLK